MLLLCIPSSIKNFDIPLSFESYFIHNQQNIVFKSHGFPYLYCSWIASKSTIYIGWWTNPSSCSLIQFWWEPRCYNPNLGAWPTFGRMTKCFSHDKRRWMLWPYLDLRPKVRHDKGSGLGECSRLDHILTSVGGWISNIPKWFFILGSWSFMISKSLGQGQKGRKEKPFAKQYLSNVPKIIEASPIQKKYTMI